MRKEEIRKLLIDHFDRAIVPFENWGNRDTPSSQESMGQLRAYLLAGCDFYLNYDYDTKVNFKDFEKFWGSEVKTMYISIKYFEFEDEPDYHTTYFPSPFSLDWCKKNKNEHGVIDWY